MIDRFVWGCKKGTITMSVELPNTRPWIAEVRFSEFTGTCGLVCLNEADVVGLRDALSAIILDSLAKAQGARDG